MATLRNVFRMFRAATTGKGRPHSRLIYVRRRLPPIVHSLSFDCCSCHRCCSRRRRRRSRPSSIEEVTTADAPVDEDHSLQFNMSCSWPSSFFNFTTTFFRTTFLILVLVFGFGGLHHYPHHQNSRRAAFFILATAAPSSARFYTIHWNSTNPIFRIDNTDNIIDVNRNNLKFEYDQVNLICPVYSPGTRDDEMEKYIIYNVSKDEYETCRITNPNPRIIAVCDKPYKLMYFTITFRPFTPQPGGLEFLPGQDYYFISTSTSDDLHRRIGGRCTTHNMKIVFKVWGGNTNVPQTLPPLTQQPFLLPPPARPTWWPMAPPHRPPVTNSPSATISNNKNPLQITTISSATKKTKSGYNKHPHPNEVVKSEELTVGGESSSGSKGANFLIKGVYPLVFRMNIVVACAIFVVL